MPLVQLDGFIGLDANGVIDPAEGGVEIELAVLEAQIVALGFGFIRGFCEDRSIGRRGVDPGGERDFGVVVEIADVADVDKARPVKAGGLTESALRKLCLALPGRRW